MKAKTAGLLKFLGPVAIAAGCYAGYTVVVSLNQGSIHWGQVMGPKPLITRELQPEQFQLLMSFLSFDALAALAIGGAMSYFGYIRKPDDV